MTRAKQGSGPFLADHNKVLWLSLTAKLAGQRPSELAGINDEIAALDFDLACSFRLEIYEDQKLETLAKRIAREVWSSGGESQSSGNENYGVNADTQVW